MTDQPPLPEVLLVSYRRADLLEQALDSVAAHLPGARVHVWDNASDGSDQVRRLAERRDDVDWVMHPVNAGFAAAVNGLMDRITGPQALLLNPDAVLEGDLAGCRGLLAADPAVAAAAPLVDEGSGPGWTNAHREPGPVRSLVSYAGWDARVRHHRALSLTYRERPDEVDGYLTGACLLISTQAWRQVGPFDERYFLYGEEADWQRRARRSGYRVVLVDEPGVRHVAAGTVADDPARASRSLALLDEARTRYLRDHHGALAAGFFGAGAAVLRRVQRSKRTAGAAPGPVIITSPTLEYGGAERQRVVLANALHARGLPVRLRLLQSAGPLEAEVESGVEAEVASYRSLAAAGRRERGAPLLVTGTTDIELAAGLAWRAAHPGGRWVVANHHPANPASQERGVFAPRAVAAMRRADGMIYLAASHRQAHARHHRLDRGRWWVVPNGIDLRAPAHRPRGTGEPLRVVSIGRLVEWKRVPTLVRALSALPDLPWTLDVWGDGPDRAAVEQAAAAAPAGRVRLRGWCDDVGAALAEADLFAQPSVFEAQPIAILEAMAAGVPVVASPAGAVPELLADGAGILVEESDEQAWTAQLRRVLSDPDALAGVGERGRRRQQERFSVAAMTDGYLQVRKEVLGG